MKIRNKILIYFSITVIILSAISLTIIYVLFSEYREEEFQQRQKEKITHTIELLAEYKEMSENLAEIMDKLTIHDFYDEKMLVFDKDKDLAYSSVDNLVISNSRKILHELSPANRWIETKEGYYDIVGVYIENDKNQFYAISKAYDDFGYSKLYFLRNVLIVIFLAISIIVTLISFYLSNKISKPITALADNLNKYEPGEGETKFLESDTSSYELKHLTERFNELLQRTNEAFAFQKNAIHHISHELKTPVAILVSELEKTRKYSDINELKSVLDEQISKAKSLGSIINVLLEVSKIESGQQITQSPVRIDEVLFDIIRDMKIIYPNFYFEVNYFPDEFEESRLIVKANKMLIKQAFKNLMTNCIAYSNNSKAEIKFDCSSDKILTISISNQGNTISKEEEKYLFDHFFRGENSKEKIGFGLGLVLAKKIIVLNDGNITYSNPSDHLNVFKVVLPLS